MKSTAQTQGRVLNIALWVAQILLGGMFLMVGFMKSFTPIDQLSATIPLAGEAPYFIRFIGISELLGGLGVILPAALRIKPELTSVAAWALGLVMVLAILFHISRGEFAALGTNAFLLALAVFVAWGRTRKAPIFARA